CVHSCGSNKFKPTLMNISHFIRRLARISVRHSCAISVAVLSMLVEVASAASLPKLPTSIEVAQEDIERARTAYADMSKDTPPFADAALQEYVASIGARLASKAPRANIQLRFTILDSEGIFAYSFADGQVVISRGMLVYLNCEAELAAVLGHEIGHISALHQARYWQQIRKVMELEAKLGKRFSSNQAREMLDTFSLAHVRGYSREQEVEADAFGEQILKSAGYEPIAMARLLNFLAQYDNYIDAMGFHMWQLPENDVGGAGVFATHPSSAARLELALKRQHAKLTIRPPDPSYLNHLNGLRYGLAERFGIQRNTLFVHASRRMAFTVPMHWYVFGNRDEIIAATTENSSIVRIRVEAHAKDESVHDAIKRMSRFDKATFEPVTTNATKGEIAIVTGEKDKPPVLLAVLDLDGQRVYCRAFTTNSETWVNQKENIQSVIRSVRGPAPQESVIEPLHVAIDQAISAGALSPAPGFTNHAQQTTELLNQLFPDGRVTAGQWIKLVR
ncbi:MAG TPA: M48 family metalloprotease, partial [Steroidobacteraceae bacterium]|nr:M48 family metalloprotease [Steroidobacteraceae bacterium]